MLEEDDEDAALDAAMAGVSAHLIQHLADWVSSTETADLALLRLRSNHLCNANEQIQEVLEISGFLTMLKYRASLDEAIGDVSG